MGENKNSAYDDRKPFPSIDAKCPDCGAHVLLLRVKRAKGAGKQQFDVLLDAAGVVAMVPYGPNETGPWPRKVYPFHNQTCSAKSRAVEEVADLPVAGKLTLADQYPNCALATEMAYDMAIEREHWPDFIAEFAELDGELPIDDVLAITGMFGYRWNGAVLTRRNSRAQVGSKTQRELRQDEKR